METRTFYQRGRIATQTQDGNRDGRADMTIFFNEDGEKARVESDTDFSGTPDAWEYFSGQALVRAERDSNNDGRVDLKVYYRNAKRHRLIRDRDHDGHFETVQWFDRAPWSMVMEVDADRNGTPEGRYCYREGVLREKRVDENNDGRFDLKEIYDAQGKITRSEEEPDENGRFALSWIYDETESAVRAERDRDGNGVPDVWFAYEQNRVVTVAEDTNGDGRPDMWEAYDGAEALVKRSRDLNFDGTPDVEERAGGS